MPEETFASQMVTKLQATLLANAGKELVVVDGVTVKFQDLTTQLEHWEAKVRLEADGLTKKPTVSSIDLS